MSAILFVQHDRPKASQILLFGNIEPPDMIAYVLNFVRRTELEWVTSEDYARGCVSKAEWNGEVVGFSTPVFVGDERFWL